MSRALGGYIGHRPVPATAAPNSAAVGMWTLREAQRLKQGGTWPVRGDPFAASVVLLLRGDSLLDTSPSARALSVNGSVAANGLELYVRPTLNFTDVNSFLRASSSTDFDFGSGDYTIETWFRPTSFPANNAGSFSVTLFGRQKTGDHSFYFGVNGTSSSFTSFDMGTWPNMTAPDNVSASYSFDLNTWYHLAASRVSGQVYMFIDGTLQNAGGTATSAVRASNQTLDIGSLNFDNTYKYPFRGQMALSRITKGVGRYITNFTPPDDF